MLTLLLVACAIILALALLGLYFEITKLRRIARTLVRTGYATTADVQAVAVANIITLAVIAILAYFGVSWAQAARAQARRKRT